MGRGSEIPLHQRKDIHCQEQLCMNGSNVSLPNCLVPRFVVIIKTFGTKTSHLHLNERWEFESVRRADFVRRV